MGVKMQFFRQFVPDPPALWLKAGLRVSLSKGHTAQVQRYFRVSWLTFGKFLPRSAENRAENEVGIAWKKIIKSKYTAPMQTT